MSMKTAKEITAEIVEKRHTAPPDYSKEYPTAWKEGYKRGREGYNKGFELRDIPTKSRFKGFWPKMAFSMGVCDGFETEQELFYQEVL